ncbi:GNAT family N-acetyltransferase [Massilia sp. CCM 9029]|uniref:GNAT family N-acetyltransferase n=1 Tax=Massilia scottii TaxID=3057166 RepID=UPI002796B228|nr:hypothetical protein [Massilia sp. CCM 9029]MDQ1833122.1 hypothetical protein [Massilia sp. CCM 9029]
MTAQAEAVIRYATLDDMEEVAALFDSYRQFYNEEPNYVGSLHYLRERVFLGESQVIVAVVGDEIAGFTQLFPSFSSVTMQRLWILNDLYVKQAFAAWASAKTCSRVRPISPIRLAPSNCSSKARWITCAPAPCTSGSVSSAIAAITTITIHCMRRPPPRMSRLTSYPPQSRNHGIAYL